MAKHPKKLKIKKKLIKELIMKKILRESWIIYDVYISFFKRKRKGLGHLVDRKVDAIRSHIRLGTGGISVAAAVAA